MNIHDTYDQKLRHSAANQRQQLGRETSSVTEVASHVVTYTVHMNW